MRRPSTHAELFDYLQANFGLGDWDDHDPDVAFWRWRLTGIAKLKAQLTSRQRSVADVVAAAEYAKAHRRGVPHLRALLDLVPEARRWLRQRARQAGADTVAQAAADALALGEAGWHQRLIRARGAYRTQVLDAWNVHREEATRA